MVDNDEIEEVVFKDKDGNIIPIDNRKYLKNPDGTKYKNRNYRNPLKYEMDKKEEEELRAEVIKKLSIINEHWDESISRNLMMSSFNYNSAFDFCLEGLELWIKALKILEKLKRGKSKK